MASFGTEGYERSYGCLIFLFFGLISVVAILMTMGPDYSEEARIVSWTLVPMLMGLGYGYYDQSGPLSIEPQELPWWKVVIYGYSGFGMFALLLSAIPHFSMILYVSSLGTVSCLIVGALIGRRFGYNWFRIPLTFLFPFGLFAIAARIWAVLFGLTGYWLVPFLLLVAIPVSLPLLKPDWSALIMKEQYNPQTQLGRRLLDWGIRVMGSAGVLGYFLASFLTDNYGYEFTLIFIAAFGSIVAAALTHVFAHQLIHGPYGG